MLMNFKAWSTIDNQMYPVIYIDADAATKEIQFIGIMKGSAPFTYEPKKDYKVLQGTVINGMEYYESDIIMFKPYNSNEYFYAVIYVENGAFMVKGPKIKPTLLSKIIKGRNIEFFDVIANAFEDPETYTDIMRKENI